MSQAEIFSLIQDYIRQQFPAANNKPLDADISLIHSGIIDSLGVLEIVTFIEQRFGVTLSDEEMVSDHFDSIGSLARLVFEKIQGDAVCNS
jgi:acyl carrier protein